jgi:hypothetical protein
LGKIIKERSFYKLDVPKKIDVITIENQSSYYKDIKNQVTERLLNNKFAIIE